MPSRKSRVWVEMGHPGSLECHILCAKGGKQAKDARSPSLQPGGVGERGGEGPASLATTSRHVNTEPPSQVFLSSSWAVSGCLPPWTLFIYIPCSAVCPWKLKAKWLFFFFFLRLLLWQFLITVNNELQETEIFLTWLYLPATVRILIQAAVCGHENILCCTGPQDRIAGCHTSSLDSPGAGKSAL